jgi:hypothetical protein
MRITLIVISIVLLAASVAIAGNGWQSAYDVRWNITVTDSCAGSAITYHNCYLTNKGQYQISFIPNQGRSGITTGKVITVYASSGCVSYIMEEAD